jgi:hypothetical protein
MPFHTIETIEGFRGYTQTEGDKPKGPLLQAISAIGKYG